MYHFCTYFDSNYLSRGLALYLSLKERCPEFRLWVLCMDEAAHAALTRLGLPEVEPIALRDFEAGDAPLAAAKQNRSRVEYFFTCTPSLVLHVLKRRPAVDLLTYLDADLYFFASPAPLFEEMGAASVAIIGHRYGAGLRHKEIHGKYNVGWLSFRRDERALECLERWRAQCLEWCHDRVEGGRFADQGYLDDWPEHSWNVVVLEHRGANLAPWNVGNYRLRSPGGDAVLVDDAPLIFFHFHFLKRIGSWLYDPGWTAYHVVPSAVLREKIYLPYLRTLDEAGCLAGSPGGAAAPSRAGAAARLSGDPVRGMQRALRRLRSAFSLGRDLLTGRLLVTRPRRRCRANPGASGSEPAARRRTQAP